MADHVLNSSVEVASRARELRVDLKTWEKEFASTHDGRKAGREDIKQHPDIAAKYKEYGRLKALESSLTRRENRQESSNAQTKKRKHASPTGPDTTQPLTTPRKSAKGLFATPSNDRKKQVNHVDEFVSPSTFRKLFSPSAHRQSVPAPSPLKAAIGPTPQRDGKALGLFDMLSESGGSTATPSAKKQKDFLAAGFQTPSKPKTFEPIAEVPEEEEEESLRLSRTPASSTKQFYLANLFATPTTMRYASIVEKDDDKEGQETAPLVTGLAASPEPNTSETPSFLRRSNFNRLPPPTSNNQSAGLSPIASRKPLQFAGKGLSHLVQGLRAMEEEREDDEWDMLRELEAEQEAAAFQVPESQAGPENGRPYKKKGQKRTTRRVIMRPVAPRPKTRPNPTLAAVEEGSEDDELVAVPETQLPAGSEVVDETYEENAPDDVASLHTISDPEADGEEPDVDSDDDPEYGSTCKPLARAKSFSERIKEAVSLSNSQAKEEPVQAPPALEKEEKAPKTRMIKANSLAHTNYRSLKIHHRGNSRGAGRFRRR
ncbi:DNA replication regulator sld2 [Penicillium rolfsii]|nr:DNA replication regulator sld2 [Penicillium rolfsii]